MTTTTTSVTTLSTTPSATPVEKRRLGSLLSCPPVVGTMGVDITALLNGKFVMPDTPLEVDVITGLLKAGVGGWDAELGTREPASLSGWVITVEALSPLLVEETRPT